MVSYLINCIGVLNLTKLTGGTISAAFLADISKIPSIQWLKLPLQYGAFGLCVVLVYAIFKLMDLQQITADKHQEERKELVKSLDRHIEKNNEISANTIRAMD